MAKDNQSRPRTIAASFSQNSEADQQLLDDYLDRERSSGKNRTEFIKGLLRSAFDTEGGVELARIRALLRETADGTAELSARLTKIEERTDQTRRLLADAVAVLLIEVAGRNQEEARTFVQQRLKREG